MKVQLLLSQRVRFGTLCAMLSIAANVHATLRVWSGGATMNNTWTNGFNWSGNVAPVAGDDLEFPFDASKVNNTNNYPNGTTFNSIYFWHGSSSQNGSFDLVGDSIDLNAGVSVTNDSLIGWGDTVHNGLLLNSNQAFATGPFTSLAFYGGINLNGKNLTFDTSASSPIDVHAAVSGTGNLLKTHPGTLTLYSNNTFTGSVTLMDGTLTLSGSAGAIPNCTNIALAGATAVISRAGGFALSSGQTLSGIGTVSGDLIANPGAVISGGNNGPGILTFNNNLTGNPGSTMIAVLNGTNAGSGYSQLYVHGNFAPNNATLAVTLGYASAAGDSFVIITNGGANPVTGTFSSLPEGTIFTTSGATFRISYVGGDGNDVVLTRTNLPTPPPPLIVTSTADSGAGSLRGTLASATNGNTIVFATNVTGNIKLTTGELVVTQSVSIIGPGPGVLAVDGNAASRAFHITNGATVMISGLTITNCATSGINGIGGGGIYIERSTLTLSNCIVVFNNSGVGPGGGIENDGSSGSATLSLLACSLSRNNTTNGNGGGIYNNGELGSANLSLVATTLANNVAAGSVVGGGIFNDGGNGSATLVMSNCTSHFNMAQDGGGIYNSANPGTGVVAVVACTFSGEDAQSGFGSCLFNRGSGASAKLGNTIFDGANLQANIENSGGPIISLGYNLCNDSGNGVLTNATDQIFTRAGLGPLADNGGPTQTHALLWGSPAIDKGKSFGLATDQRGVPRPYDFSTLTNASAGDGSDIGAVEFVPPAPVISISMPTNSIQLQGAGLSNLTYTIRANTNLTTTNWVVIGSALANSGGGFTFTDTNAPLYPRRFYRLVYP